MLGRNWGELGDSIKNESGELPDAQHCSMRTLNLGGSIISVGGLNPSVETLAIISNAAIPLLKYY
jgi:hypothetical protein